MIGETLYNFTLSRDNHCFTLEALVVDNIDVGVLAGVPFMTVNDIRPSQRQILLSDGTILEYCAQPFHGAHAVRRAHACVWRAPLLQLQCGPGISLSYKFPLTIFLMTVSSPWSLEQMSILFNKWPLIHGPFHASYRVSVVKSTSRNLPPAPLVFQRNNHFCQVYPVSILGDPSPLDDTPCAPSSPHAPTNARKHLLLPALRVPQMTISSIMM